MGKAASKAKAKAKAEAKEIIGFKTAKGDMGVSPFVLFKRMSLSRIKKTYYEKYTNTR